MPKQKTHKGASKRVQPNGNGKRLKRRSANRGHILTKKTAKRKLHLRSPSAVSRADTKQMRRLLREC